MTIRVWAIAAILFLLIAMTDRNKPMIKKCGRISAALVVLFVNMIVDMGAASAFASWLKLDQLFLFAREILYAVGLSGTADFSLEKNTHVVESVSAKHYFNENKSNNVGFFNYSCISAKRLN